MSTNRAITLAAPALAVLALLAASPAEAQLSTNSGGGSLFGSGGGSLFGGGATGGAGAGGFGQGGFGQGGFGQGGFGTIGAGTSPFVLNQQGGSGGFVGRDNTDTGAMFEALNQQNQFLNQIQRTFAARNRGRGANDGTNAPTPIRVTLSLGFRPPASPQIAAGPTTSRINSMLGDRGFTSARAQVESGVVRLEGTVADDSDRRMLARLAAMEPGVSSVENNLLVEGEPDELLPPPAP